MTETADMWNTAWQIRPHQTAGAFTEVVSGTAHWSHRFNASRGPPLSVIWTRTRRSMRKPSRRRRSVKCLDLSMQVFSFCLSFLALSTQVFFFLNLSFPIVCGCGCLVDLVFYDVTPELSQPRYGYLNFFFLHADIFPFGFSFKVFFLV